MWRDFQIVAFTIVCLFCTQVGAQVRTTHVIKKDLNPRWDEVFEYIVDEVSGQMLEIEVFDKDDGDKDDFLGR